MNEAWPREKGLPTTPSVRPGASDPHHPHGTGTRLYSTHPTVLEAGTSIGDEVTPGPKLSGELKEPTPLPLLLRLQTELVVAFLTLYLYLDLCLPSSPSAQVTWPLSLQNTD